VNYVRDALADRPRSDPALVSLAADGERRELDFGELLDGATASSIRW
jgi:hypothetical protein